MQIFFAPRERRVVDVRRNCAKGLILFRMLTYFLIIPKRLHVGISFASRCLLRRGRNVGLRPAERERIARVSTKSRRGNSSTSPLQRLDPRLEVLVVLKTFRDGVVIISVIARAGDARAELLQRSKSRGGM
jgi:hypothetical protein